jgi:4-oxalocrotonate tautomerase
MPFIRFEIWPVTTREQREKLAKGVTEVVQQVLGVPAEVVTVVFNEIPQDRWAVAGKIVETDRTDD